MKEIEKQNWADQWLKLKHLTLKGIQNNTIQMSSGERNHKTIPNEMGWTDWNVWNKWYKHLFDDCIWFIHAVQREK